MRITHPSFRCGHGSGVCNIASALCISWGQPGTAFCAVRCSKFTPHIDKGRLRVPVTVHNDYAVPGNTLALSDFGHQTVGIVVLPNVNQVLDDLLRK